MVKKKALDTSKKNIIVLLVFLFLFASLQVLLYISDRNALVLKDIRGVLFVAMIGVLLIAIFRSKKTIPDIVTKEDALKLAHEYCLENNLPWMEKIQIYSKGYKWVIHSHYPCIGGNVWVEISKRTGEILGAGFAPR